MEKRKVEMEPIDDKNKRNATFSKCRKGLFNEAKKTCQIDPTMKMSLVAFSPAGEPYSFHHPSVDTAIDKFVNEHKPSDCRQSDMKEGISMDAQRSWWEKVNVDELQTMEELRSFENELVRLKNMAMTSLRKIESLRSSEASTASSISVDCGSDEGGKLEDDQINTLLECHDPVTPPHP